MGGMRSDMRLQKERGLAKEKVHGHALNIGLRFSARFDAVLVLKPEAAQNFRQKADGMPIAFHKQCR